MAATHYQYATSAAYYLSVAYYPFIPAHEGYTNPWQPSDAVIPSGIPAGSNEEGRIRGGGRAAAFDTPAAVVGVSARFAGGQSSTDSPFGPRCPGHLLISVLGYNQQPSVRKPSEFVTDGPTQALSSYHRSQNPSFYNKPNLGSHFSAQP